MAAYPKLDTRNFEQKVLATTEFSSIIAFTPLKSTQTDESFVLKTGRTRKAKQYLLNEYTILRYLSFQGNENIIRPLGIVEHDSSVGIKLPFINATTLREYVFSRGFLSEDEIKTIFLKIVDVVAFVHRFNYAHCDLKPDNILYNTKTQRITLIDFGLSKVDERKGPVRVAGSLHYLAPELISKKSDISLRCADVWSLGIILYFLVYKKRPFISRARSRSEVFEKIQNGIFIHKDSGRLKEIESISPSLKNLLESILQVNPNDRISLSKIVEHSWFY
jgi:serine/threonine protein kinase